MTDEGLFKAFPHGSIKSERVLRTIQRGFYGAAVETREEKCGAPDAFFGHRKSYGVTEGDG